MTDQRSLPPAQDRPLPLRYWLFRVEAVWVLLALWMPFGYGVSAPIFLDTWWILKAGEVIVEAGHLYVESPFSFGPHSPDLVNNQWLPQVLFYLSYRLSGLEGTGFFGGVLITGVFALLLLLSWERCRNVRLAVICVLLAGIAAGSYLVPMHRARSFGYLAFLLTYWLLTRRSQRPWTIAGLVAIEVVWANSHGTFVLGPALTCLLLAGQGVEVALARGWRALAGTPRLAFLGLALVAQSVATLATPYGLRPHVETWRVLTDPLIREFIGEWESPTLRDWEGIALFLSLVVVVAAIVLSHRRFPVADALVLVFFAVLALQAIRNIDVWMLAATPIVTGQLAGVPIPQRLAALGRWGQAPDRPLANAALAGLLLLAAIPLLPWLKGSTPWLPDEKRAMVYPWEPEGAASFLLPQALPSRMLSFHGWTAYLNWRLWPRYQTMLDVWLRARPPEVWPDYVLISFGHATWQERLDRHGVDLMVLHRDDHAYLIELARASPRWREVYEDRLAVIFTRVP